MPYKDVNLNGQIRYILEPQSASPVKLKMSDSKSRIVDKSIEPFPFEKKVIYASCFKDGVYRYPKDFDNLEDKIQYKPNATKLIVSSMPGKKMWFKYPIFLSNNFK